MIRLLGRRRGGEQEEEEGESDVSHGESASASFAPGPGFAALPAPDHLGGLP